MTARLIASLALAPLLAAHPLTGRVVQDDNGAPAASAEERIYRAGAAGLAADLESGADGRFTADLPPGDYRIEIAKPNFAGSSLLVTHTAARPDNVTVRLIRYAALSGRVTTADGRPVRNATVLLLTPQPSGPLRRVPGGSPIEDAAVSVFTNARFANRAIAMTASTKRIQATSDRKGAYRLADLPAGRYNVSVRLPGRGLRIVNRVVTLRPGEDLTSIDLTAPASGSISGLVLDQNKEPVVKAAVYLIVEEYAGGATGYFARNMALTDDRGEYRLENVPPGTPYLLMARKSLDIGVRSEAPFDPKRRRPAYVPTYYPSSPEPEGGAPVRVQPRETREGADILLARAPAWCVSGIIETATGRAAGRLMVRGREMNFGVSSGGGLAMLPPGGPVPADGKFRICDLAAGDYTVMALLDQPPADPPPPPQLATARVAISDGDLAGVRLFTTAGLTVTGAVAWADKPPNPPLANPVSVYLMSAGRGVTFRGEAGAMARVAVPADFSIENVLPGDYLCGRTRRTCTSRTSPSARTAPSIVR